MWPDVGPAVTCLIESGRPWLDDYGLLAVFIGLLTETFMLTGVFVPGFGILFAAGFFVAADALPVWPVLALAWLGSIIGDQLSYLLGRFLGFRLMHRRRQLADRIQGALQSEAPLLLLTYHYSPIFRPVVPYIAGTVGLRRNTWLLFDSAGAIIWVAAILLLGYTSYGALVGTSAQILQATNSLVTLLVLWITFRIRKSLVSQSRSTLAAKEETAPAPAERGDVDHG